MVKEILSLDLLLTFIATNEEFLAVQDMLLLILPLEFCLASILVANLKCLDTFLIMLETVLVGVNDLVAS